MALLTAVRYMSRNHPYEGNQGLAYAIDKAEAKFEEKLGKKMGTVELRLLSLTLKPSPYAVVSKYFPYFEKPDNVLVPFPSCSGRFSLA